MQRYFSNQKQGDTFLLSKDDSYHIQTVMRMKMMDKIEVVYQEELYICEILEFTPFVIARISLKVEQDTELSISVTLVQSAVKEQKMDYILQKATELGVSSIYPYQAERSVVKLGEKWDKKKERWQKVVKEASEQSKRVIIPKIGDLLTTCDMEQFANFDYKLLCTVNEKTKVIKKVLSKCKKGDTMVVIVGPEGGFTELEEKRFEDAGFVSVSLGKSVLRTETASSFILSAVRYIDME